ncbi:ribonuclease [Tissierella creatinini]|nr:ribonuclease [Tissierella creatinini]TJX65097.1 ribonuclease [Soehngenia saccharolytica]
MKKKFLCLSLIIVMILSLMGCSTKSLDVVIPNNNETSAIDLPYLPESENLESEISGNQITPTDKTLILEDGQYTTLEDVSLYIHIYNKLPSNYITKNEAMDLGWESSKGNLWDITDEKIIGGDRFGNREGLLPKADGRIYYEADINYEGGFRGPERIVFSNDGLIFYTKDHYDSFEKLY